MLSVMYLMYEGGPDDPHIQRLFMKLIKFAVSGGSPWATIWYDTPHRTELYKKKRN